MPPDDKPTTTVPAIQTSEPVRDVFDTYANQALYEPSWWDLKIIFGQLDQSGGTPTVRRKVAVTVPWMQAKLALYYLRVQVEAMELQSGKIPIRKDLLPPEPPPLTEGQEKDPMVVKMRELALRIRNEFLASLEGDAT